MTRTPHPYTADPEIYLVSGDGICRNNMHYESGRAGYLPNDASTSESQALLARGYVRHYLATGRAASLANARILANAAIRYFFLGDPPDDPSTPWNHHWVVNAGDSFNIKGPVSPDGHAFDGVVAADVTFTDGVANLPATLSNVYGVFTGAPVWGNVFSKLQDGGQFHEIDYFVDRDGYLFTYVSGSADSIEFSVPNETQSTIAPGTLRLKDTTLSGNFRVSYALWDDTISVDYTARYDAWPLWHAMDDTTFNTAPDAIGWFVDLFDLLARHDTLTPTRWGQARDALLSIWQKACVLTSSVPFLFRRDPDGVTYDSWPLTYLNVVMTDGSTKAAPTSALTYARKAGSGLAVFTLPADVNRAAFRFVQDAASLTLGAVSGIRAEVSSTVAQTLSLRLTARLATGESGTWTASLQATTALQTTILSLADFGMGGVLAWLPGTTEFTFGALQASTVSTQTDTGQSVLTRTYVIANTGAGAGFSVSSVPGWSDGTAPVLAYLTSQATGVLTVIDAAGWRWEYSLPSRSTADPLVLSWSNFRASSYQTNTGSPPTQAGTATGALQTIQWGNTSSTTPYTLQVIAVYSAAPYSLGAGAVLSRAEIVDTITDAHTLTIGDVQVTGATTVNQPYTPGALPFGLGSSSTGRYSSGGGGTWQGPAYIGYQQPAVWSLIGDFSAAKNMLQMMRDSQKAYAAQSPSGTSGPFVPAWLFHQWDSEQYGTGGTFVFNGPDPNWFWGGYTYRAFAHAADFWQRCVLAGYTADASGTDAEQATALAADVAGAFMGWLNTWLGLHSGATAIPTQFLAAQDPSDIMAEPHQVALALKGALWCKMAGYDSNICATVIDRLFGMLDATVVTVGDMAGSLSPNPDRHQFYGFWAGEILDALSLYMLYYGSE